MAGAPSGSPASQPHQTYSATTLGPTVPVIPQQSINVSQVPSLTTTVPESEQQRRQSIARAAAGLPEDNTAQLTKTSAPSWSEAILSKTRKAETSKLSSTTQKKFGDPSQAPLLGTKLQTLCQSIDPSYTLDSKVQESLLEMADGFIDRVTQDALKLARHRGSNILDVVDVALALKKGYGIEVPGLGGPSVPTGSVSKNMIGGWLFANKLSVDERSGKKPRLK
jgi:transcription initiation factor TFIID subunit TAF12